MAERPTRAPEIPVRTLGGLNERPSKANLRPGEFSALEGLYPASVGLQARIPGKVAVDSFSGVVLQIINTQNTNGDVLYQVGDSLYASTIDEIQGRAVAPSLAFNPISEEETMSMAIIVQREANGVNGGSAQGYISGTDSSSASNTFYGRRLTDILVNESSTVTTFTASTGGGGVASTEGTFTLSPGTYRITINATYFTNGADAMFGLYNVTSAAFEVYSGGSAPLISSPGATVNTVLVLEAKITVASTNKTFSIRHQSTATAGRSLSFCGSRATGTATVNGATTLQNYCFIKILKVS